MFWSANYVGMRELNFLLKEENVTLTQILEADDILQECKADNKALIQFLTRSENLAELITLITEEPPKDVELTSQYRHSNIACEVLTSQLSTLSHRLCMDPVQMNRLCDFVNREPPLNPLLASYFSRTVEMLLKRSPKQDCYLHHIVCFRALDFFKARKDFLPNLLRHISTSAIADTFKYFIGLSDPFDKIIMEWLDEHQFLEKMIQIVCCNYEPEEIQPAPVPVTSETQSDVEKGLNEQSEKVETNHNHVNTSSESDNSIQEERKLRMRAIASANATALLCDMTMAIAAPDITLSETEYGLTTRLRSAALVTALLQGAFTCAPAARRHALVNACRLLLALTHRESAITVDEGREVELAVAPHLPLLHQTLLREVPDAGVAGVAGATGVAGVAGSAGVAGGPVGAARVHVAALIARLVVSDVEDVHNAILSLGTVGVLLDMFFTHAHNNFLHAQVCELLHNIEVNEKHSQPYYKQILDEYDLPTRLMDVFEANEDKKVRPRAALMGHVAAMCHSLQWAGVCGALQGPRAQRWARFVAQRLQPLRARHDTPLGGEFAWDMLQMKPNKENFVQLGTEQFEEDFWNSDSYKEVLGKVFKMCSQMFENSRGWDEGAGEGAESAARDLAGDLGLAGADLVGADLVGAEMYLVNKFSYNKIFWIQRKCELQKMVKQQSKEDYVVVAQNSAGGTNSAPYNLLQLLYINNNKKSVCYRKGIKDLAAADRAAEDRVAELFAGAGLGDSGLADAGADEGWAHFSDVCPPPVDPFAPPSTWPNDDPEVDLSQKMENMDAKFGEMVSLTNNLLSAMSCMAPQDIATIVNDNAIDNIAIPLIQPEKPGLDADNTSAPSDVTNVDVTLGKTDVNTDTKSEEKSNDSCVAKETPNPIADVNRVQNEVHISPSASASSDTPNTVHDNVHETKSSDNDSQCDVDTSAGNDSSNNDSNDTSNNDGNDTSNNDGNDTSNNDGNDTSNNDGNDTSNNDGNDTSNNDGNDSSNNDTSTGNDTSCDDSSAER
ncbi:serine/threonine-protein phosphatase 6 regulatory subunit 3 [Colias croceus]|uniref:serine/threonine-protein phosphatase 6 regulatory subunit 3 n=1 Tax=Colias crocea TaxID=72248 RepID=UPI001E280BA0|nr:serine/threonine-protein phosphatase 6 regulatory subunit 3 [Colias croceus]